MKRLMLTGLVAGAFLLNACAPVNYGTPYQTHSSVTVFHNSHGGGHYDQRRIRIDRELSRRHHRVAHIYRGDGRPGDLIEVTISSGRFYHQGRAWKYQPTTFRIAAGDIIRFPARGLDIDLFIRYQHGFLALDTDIFGNFSHTLGLSYAADWERGRSYRIHDNYFRNAHFKVKAMSPRNHHGVRRGHSYNQRSQEPRILIKKKRPHVQGRAGKRDASSIHRERTISRNPVTKDSQQKRVQELPERRAQKRSVPEGRGDQVSENHQNGAFAHKDAPVKPSVEGLKNQTVDRHRGKKVARQVRSEHQSDGQTADMHSSKGAVQNDKKSKSRTGRRTERNNGGHEYEDSPAIKRPWQAAARVPDRK